ncbi:hypothetical protein [Gluconobacter japonicus]|uniref:Uncharacterized protein n=1 Tax=Gluconobacter japonicus TaxID=376620 RepID=A0ABQ5WIR2_GLUJA|nr:hypothetical protein [Gluconobacter japonicus]GBR25705.1 hypothetical protein AA3271_2104 [Gluconobacter japonicus NBRC 3271]GLQ59925.1 hypothetical protein GCM10010937_17280 [Gluconobacter japonicus]
MRGSAMRQDNVTHVTPMLRVPSRPGPEQPEHARPAPDTPVAAETPAPAQSDEPVISHGRVPDPPPSQRGHRVTGLSRLLAGGTAIALAGGALTMGIAVYGPRLGIMVPFLMDKPKAAPQTAAPKAAPPPQANALTPPALGQKTDPGPSPAAPPFEAAGSDESDPFGGSGIAVQSGQVSTPPAPAQTPVQLPATPPMPQSTAPVTVQPAPAASPAVQTAQPPVPSASVATSTPDSAPSPDAKLELELAGKLHELDVHVSALDQRLSAVQDTLGERINMGLGKVSGRLDELEHREDQTDQALKATPKPTRKGNAPPAGSGTASGTKPAPTQKAQPPAPSRPVYHVQAGAPGIAILQDSSGNPIRVENGETIPGWGLISAITQTGSGWVVHTEHGSIR